MGKRVSRRNFLSQVAKTALAAGAGLAFPAIVPARALGAEGKDPANERIGLGFIGVGGMGSGHLRRLLNHPTCEVIAVCDVDEARRNSARQRVGERCLAFGDFRKLLERKDIDAVVIATPDHWHALTSIYACQAGKDVYCEKPLSLTIAEGRKMVEAVRRYGRVFQTGSQQRSAWEFRFACELVRNGYIGKLHTVRTGVGGGPTCGWEPDCDPPPGLDWDMWLGPAPWVPFNPRRHPYNFRWFWDYSGGKMTDWGAHHNDIAQWGIGADGTGPIYIDGWGKFPEDGLYETCTQFEVRYEYANGVVLICSSSGSGCRFEGTDGWVHVNRGRIETYPEDLMHVTFKPDDIRLYHSPGHHQDWLNCIKTRQRPICDVEIGHRSVTVCHLGNISIRLGRPLRWDPDKERFVNDEVANRWLNKPYRAPWHL